MRLDQIPTLNELGLLLLCRRRAADVISLFVCLSVCNISAEPLISTAVNVQCTLPVPWSVSGGTEIRYVWHTLGFVDDVVLPYNGCYMMV